MFEVNFSKAIRLDSIEPETFLKVFYDNDRYEIKWFNDDGSIKHICFPKVYEANCVLYFDKCSMEDISILFIISEIFDIKFKITN